jgi:2-octaprenyl-6-methoxyphenol hydroxylase
MSLERVDIFVSGGGIAGLAAAAAFSRAGFSVLLADPGPDPAGADPADTRSTAFLAPARDLLERAGLWQDLAPHAVPLDALRVVDAEGEPPRPVTSRTFRPQDLGAEHFGWNLPNALTRRHLAAALAARGGVTLAWNTGFSALLARTAEARVTLDDGRRLAARLAVAADGAASPLREAAGIGARSWRYGQTAFAFTAAHAEPHGNVSTEIYDSGGAFTTVPLADTGNGPASAIVWMNDARRAEDLAALPEAGFDAAMTARACSLLGPMRRTGPIGRWPVITRTAERLTAERVALVAEAAHVLPPIGAQGLNTSLLDVAALAALAEQAPESLGSPEMLTRYAARRASDIAARARLIDLYNRLCRSGEAPARALRRAGLQLVHDTPALRRATMRAGVGG